MKRSIMCSRASAISACLTARAGAPRSSRASASSFARSNYKRLAGSEDTRSPQPIRIARDTLEVTAAAVVTPASDVTPEWRREAERFAQRRQQRQASAGRHSSTSFSITFCSSRRFARLRRPCLRLPILMSFCASTTAVLCGGAIGLERDLRRMPTGFRTMAIVSLGACVVAVAGLRTGDPARLQPHRSGRRHRHRVSRRRCDPAAG